MCQANTEQDPMPHDGNERTAGSDLSTSICGRGPDWVRNMKGCPCAGMLKKRHFVAGFAVLSVIFLAFLATVVGSVLGTIAFVQSL